jgi:hypothetical protein
MNNVHITVVFDRSGSMSARKTDAEGGLAAFLEAQETADTTCSLYEFDNEFQAVYENVPLADVPPYVLVPRGGTALLDAVGRALAATKEAVKGTEKKVVVAVVTDGHENSSTTYTLPGIRKKIEKRREKGWEVIFLGCEEDAIDVAAAMGIPRSRSVYVDPSNLKGGMLHAGEMVMRGTVSGVYAYTETERTASGLAPEPETP